MRLLVVGGALGAPRLTGLLRRPYDASSRIGPAGTIQDALRWNGPTRWRYRTQIKDYGTSMANSGRKRADRSVSKDLDALALAHEVVAWYSSSGRQELEAAMEVAQRDRARLARSLEVSPRVLGEAVTF